MREEKKFELGALTVVRVQKFTNAVGMFVDLGVMTDMGMLMSCGWRVGISGKTDKPYIFTPDSPQIETSGRNKGKVKKNAKGFDMTNDISYFVDPDELDFVEYPFQAKVKRGVTPKFRKVLMALLESEFGGNNVDDDTQDDDAIPMDA